MSEINYNSIFENFEKFWTKYPKKVWKKTAFQKFKNVKDFKNLFEWLDQYIKKRELEWTRQEHILNPATFLNQERYYDEIIIDPSKKIKNKEIAEKQKEIKEIEQKENEAEKKRRSLIMFYNTLSLEEKINIWVAADIIIRKDNPVLYEKKWLFFDSYKKIIIRNILNNKLKENV
jgi:hypothetical protein